MSSVYIIILATILIGCTNGVTYPERKCQGTENGQSRPQDESLPSVRKHYKSFEEMYRGCQLVEKNLELVGFKSVEENMTFDFLSEIREVLGYVLIIDMGVKLIPLDNLVIIRGHANFPLDDRNWGFVARNIELSEPEFPVTVFMPKLKEISNGGVFIGDAEAFCYLENINWRDIVRDSEIQKVEIYSADEEKLNEQCEPCHKSCKKQSKYQRGCWGPKKELCQTLTRVHCAPKCQNGCLNGNSNECCEMECAAGCSGTQNSECSACRNIFHNGKCLKECPSHKTYDASKQKYVTNTESWYNNGQLCAEKCPDNMFQEEESCVSLCGSEYKLDYKHRLCVPCSGDCPVSCQSSNNYLKKNDLQKFENCSIVHGSIYIINGSFEDNDSISVDDLKVLKDVKLVTDDVVIEASRPEFKNLLFLRNLIIIQGQKLSRFKTSFLVHGTSLEQLGLNSLKSIQSGDVQVSLSPNLCYVDTINWFDLTSRTDQNVKIEDVKNRTECESQQKTCNVACDPASGCMGSGNDQCMACLRMSYLNLCLLSCDGFSDVTPLFAVNNNTCARCHEQCTMGCTGPLDSQCWACANYRWNLTCVLECPVEMTYNSRYECISRKREAMIAGLSVLIAVLVIGGLILIVMCYKKQIARSEEEKFRIAAQLSGDLESEPLKPTTVRPNMAKLRLIKESELRRGGIVGSGAFGTVYKGLWIPEGEDIRIPVAIKILQSEFEDENGRPLTGGENDKELLEEAQIMASAVNQFCIRILAICMGQRMMLISQFMPHGCLLDYIQHNKHKIGSQYMLNWCSQIAKGMAYLEEKCIIHRDLAARNVLVQTPNHIRITDFGLAKLVPGDNKFLSEGGKLPIKWLAIESIREKTFTHKSDVWSFGVTLWEIFTFGQRPYDSVPIQNLVNQLEKGERLTQPSVCTIDVYMILIKCWLIDANARPKFKELADIFTEMAHDPGRYLVIENDELKRIPSETLDTRETLSLGLLEENEDFVIAEDYLNAKIGFSSDNRDSGGSNANNRRNGKTTKERPKTTLIISPAEPITEDKPSSGSATRYTPDPTNLTKDKLFCLKSCHLSDSCIDSDQQLVQDRTSPDNYLIPNPQQPASIQLIDETDNKRRSDPPAESNGPDTSSSEKDNLAEVNANNYSFLCSIENPEYFGNRM